MSFPNKHRKQRRNLYRSWAVMGIVKGPLPGGILTIRVQRDPVLEEKLEKLRKLYNQMMEGLYDRDREAARKGAEQGLDLGH